MKITVSAIDTVKEGFECYGKCDSSMDHLHFSFFTCFRASESSSNLILGIAVGEQKFKTLLDFHFDILGYCVLKGCLK